MRGASKLRRVAVLALIIGLVAQSAVTPALAAPDDPCEDPVGADSFLKALGLGETSCTAEKLGSASQADLSASAKALADMRKGAVAPITNRLEDTRSIAQMEGKSVAVQNFLNGSTKSETKAAVNQTLEDYYTTIQLNLWETHEANANQVAYVYNASNSTSGIDDYTVQIHEQNTKSDSVWPSAQTTTTLLNDDALIVENKSVDLLNGTTVNSTMLVWDQTDYPNVTKTRGHPVNKTFSDDGYAQYEGFSVFVVEAERANFVTGSSNITETNYDLAYSELAYREVNDKINNQASNVIENATGNPNNATSYVDSLYATYDSPSDLNVTDVLSPVNLAREWNTNVNSTGSYGWLAAEYGLTNLNGSVESAFAINYTPRSNHTRTEGLALNGSGNVSYGFMEGESYNMSGTLYADGSATFEVGKTYNTSNFNGVVFIEQINGSARTVELNGTFEIVELTNVTSGESINQTSLTDQTYSTWNASSTEAELNDLAEYRNQVTESYSTSGGGGGGGGLFDGFDFGSAGIGFIVIAGGALLVLSNRS